MGAEREAAASTGDRDAQYALGVECITTGDVHRADVWLGMSAREGHASAACRLGALYMEGLLGGAKDDADAVGVRWLQQAAAGGDAEAVGLLQSIPPCRMMLLSHLAERVALELSAKRRSGDEEDDDVSGEGSAKRAKVSAAR
eukprot:TRINITY_DN18514_c0_g1_i1.p2 TRINITY_DN18514_c0_g1~~TRINITY_DN18514_c0_g1_i1.p2  ORF type:complete len:143 (+),score=5.86 TRINITY_DN18514_c0_g1_i1:127-555(+)